MFCYGWEYSVNDELVDEERWGTYSVFDHKRGGFPVILCISFTGCQSEIEDGAKKIKYVSYDDLSFCLQIPAFSTSPLWDGNNHTSGPPCLIFIPGNGEGPFVAGEEYSSANNLVAYYPGHFYRFVDERTPVKNELPLNDWRGLEVEILTSSFQFGYSQMNDCYYNVEKDVYFGNVEILDFYFDFTEVILSTPEGHVSPAVGDTIRVTNGHFRQAISGPNDPSQYYDIHQLVVEQ